MKIIEEYLSSKDLEFIPELIGQNIYMIYSNTISCDVNNHVFEASSFSLSLEKGFFSVRTDWIDKNEYEYYQLKLSRNDDPIGIERNQDKSLIDPSSISIIPASKIVSIELYSDNDEEEWNGVGRELITVKYDSAFLFHQEDGNLFLIGVSKTIANLTQFIRNKVAINNKLKMLEKRFEWK